MYFTLDIEGLNLERLLRTAAAEGIVLHGVRRRDARTVRVRVPVQMRAQLLALCERYGWQTREAGAGALIGAVRFLRRRCMFAAGMLLCAALVYASSHLVLAVRIENAAENVAEVRVFLREEGVRPGVPKGMLSTDALRDKLALRLPGLAHVGVRYAGSTMIISCQSAREGEQTDIPGAGLDIVAAQSGVITRIVAGSGTPVVEPGQAVYAGQVLISGQERTGGGETVSVRAQGEVTARVFARGDARVSLMQRRTVETGRTSRRISVHSPWHERVLEEGTAFESQDVSVERQAVVGLYVPLWRRIETRAETVVVTEPRDEADAMSMAQGAAEKIAKNKCPARADILDKWVNYSMIDDEFVYATVVLEYEMSIGARQ